MKYHHLEEVKEKLFASKQKYKDDHNDLMQKLVILIKHRLYGVKIRKDINESYKCKSQRGMETEYDDNVLDYWRFPNRNNSKTKNRRWIRW